MSGVLLHDGRRNGHSGWCTSAIMNGAADGVIISPFSTPRFSLPRAPSGGDFAAAVRASNAEIIFDPMTHARLMPGTNKLDHYNTWELWGQAGIGLDTPARRLEHIEHVFARQVDLNVPALAPTLTLELPQTPDAGIAIATAQLARGLRRDCWQSLSGTRSFWRAGPSLDAYVGRLAALRAPVWVITVANEFVTGQVPDLEDIPAFVGLCRTIHSLSERSRVIVTHADFAGLVGIAAGADTLGSGWDRSMRVFDPISFHVNSDDSPRIPASYVTQGGLTAVLRRDTADAIERWNSGLAIAIRGGAMPPSDQAERIHHLKILRDLVVAVNMQSDRHGRVTRLRAHYDNAGMYFDSLISALRQVVVPADKKAWRNNQFEILRSYAAAEQLWLFIHFSFIKAATNISDARRRKPGDTGCSTGLTSHFLPIATPMRRARPCA